jgi:hypothetical protein
MTLDASGNLLVGTTSGLGTSNRATLVNNQSLRSVIAIQNTSTSGYSSVELYNSSGTQTGAMGYGNASVSVTAAQDNLYLYSASAITFLSGGTSEKARIDSSGNLLVGTTSLDGRFRVSQDNISWARVTNHTYSGTQFFDSFRYNGTEIGQITGNNSNVSYVTSSDYRLKENIAPMTGALAKVAQLKPCTYTWKVDGATGQGFIAHELQAVVPDAVVGEKDAVNEDGSIKPQGIDTSFLVATLTAAIQELKAEFDAYKASHP